MHCTEVKSFHQKNYMNNIRVGVLNKGVITQKGVIWAISGGNGSPGTTIEKYDKNRTENKSCCRVV